MTNKKATLISGASTGIGRQCAIDLAMAGFTVYAGVRKTFESFSENLDILPVFLDVTDTASIGQAFQIIENDLLSKNIGGLFGLVNNAGIVVGGPVECVPLEKLKRQFDVNVIGAIAVTQKFLPLLRHYSESTSKHQEEFPKIINISSIAGRSNLPFAAPYSASKHALEAFSDALRIELSPWKIQVVLIEPGVIKTPIWEKSLKDAETVPEETVATANALYGDVLKTLRKYLQGVEERGLSAEHVSRKVLNVLTQQKPRARYLVGNDAKFRSFLNCLPTPWLDALIRKRLYGHSSFKR